jgi:hypothetical protein
MKTIHFAMLIMLLAGCTGTHQTPTTAVNVSPQNTSAPEPSTPNVTLNTSVENLTNATAPDCTRYCENGTCQGAWNISGTYPACICGCQVPKNDTVSNAPRPELINITIAQLLGAGMEKLQTSFYMNNSGTFKQNSYTWYRIATDTDMNDISFVAAPPDDVKVDNQSLGSIVASGFTVFEGDNMAPQSYGLLIAKGERTILDDYSGSFSLDYFPPTINKRLDDCAVYAKDYYITANGDNFVSYSFVCWKTYDK